MSLCVVDVTGPTSTTRPFRRELLDATSSSMAEDALQRVLARALARRERIGTLRKLQPATSRDAGAAAMGPANCVDFYSNDYLGIARDPDLLASVQQRRDEIVAAKPHLALTGATGSRLISGNNEYFMHVEEELARFYNRYGGVARPVVCLMADLVSIAAGCSEAALLFNSGYAANLGVLSSLPQANDVVLYDELIHNSCHEGLRLSRAYPNNHTVAFRHNDIADLETKLQQHAPSPNGSQRCVFVVVESVYSMDGDVAPLVEMTQLCERYGAYVIVDEAHGVGVYGPQGSGVVRELGLDVTSSRVLCCRVYTFGKAMGCHGAVVCGSRLLIDYLVNYARSFIYTTAFPFEQLVTVQCAHELCARADDKRRASRQLVQYFKRRVQESPHIPGDALLQSDSPIQGVVFSGNHAVLDAARQMVAMGVRVIAIRSPTVPKGAERFRIIIHSHNTPHEIDQLITALERMFQYRGATNRKAAGTDLVASAVVSRL
jgi:8-amino-7-oxononanoate synthase